MYYYGPPHMAEQKQDDQRKHTHSSYVRIWDVALKTCRSRWRIGRSGEKGSGISVVAARHDDDDDSCLKAVHVVNGYLIDFPPSEVNKVIFNESHLWLSLKLLDTIDIPHIEVPQAPRNEPSLAKQLLPGEKTPSDKAISLIELT